MKIHNVKGSSGVNLHVREWGQAAGIPILLIHGWSQNHLCWLKQYESDLQRDFCIVAFDLRGHGMSDGPLEAEQYTDGDKWADDIAAIIEQLALDKPVLVGWSYGGFVISDYVRKHGQGKIAGINFVDGAVVLGPKAFGTLIGPGFLENAPGGCEMDVPTNIAGVRGLLHACAVKPIGQDAFEVALAAAMLVHPKVRGSLIQRDLDFSSVLRDVTVPVLVTHGRLDVVVLPAMGDYILEQCRTAQASWYEGVGHVPFLEDTERFNRELAAFARRAHAPRAHA
ncbi:MAG TPA: alpha/beta hydrolase [Candidatus Acidoferrales bacterium]|nr:alpha/beta hydrolase [Candidatus Acidoferrales bacterium]